MGSLSRTFPVSCPHSTSYWRRKDTGVGGKNNNLLLTSSSVLMHFDASPYGVGAVLSHQTEEGERPIAFASRTLSPAERKYAHLDKEGLSIICGVHLDKEGLSIIFGVKKFHGYLFGRKFVIRSDHKPLQRLFDIIPEQYHN